MIWHYVGCNLKPGHRDFAFFIWKATSLTWCGVDIFFVLSGFLIGGILIDNQRSPHFFRTFYVRRAARIFPMYYAIVFLTFGITLLGIRDVPGSSPLFDGHFSPWAYLSYTQNLLMSHYGNWGFRPLGLTWSLAIEEQFYLVFPLVVYFTPIQRLPHLLFLGIFSGWIIRIGLLHFHPHPEFSTYTLLPARCDALFMGGLIAWCIRHNAAVFHRLRVPSTRVVIGLTILAIYASLSASHAGIGSPLAVYVGHTWFALSGSAVIVICITSPDSGVAHFFRQRWLRWLGGISYTLYLVHDMVLHATFWAFTGSSSPKLDGLLEILLTCTSIIISLTLATLSWKYFEKPLIAKIRARAAF